MAKNLAEITSSVYSLLEGLNSEQRKRVISSTLPLFGDKTPDVRQDKNVNLESSGDNDESIITGKQAI